jgi:lysophospholipase L1-like esterase
MDQVPASLAKRYLRATTLGGLVWLAACSSTSSPGTSDAGTDAHIGNRDAGDGHSPRNDGQPASDGGASDAMDGGGGTPDTGASPDGSPDALVDASQEANVDAPVDAIADAGPPALRYVGRILTDGTSPDGDGNCTVATPCFEWSGTQVIARFTGATAVDLTMSDYGNYFDVYVDGTLQTGGPIIGVGSQSSYPIATGLDAAMTHDVSLYKRTEASTIGRTMIQGVTFPNGGTLLSPSPASTRRIEVIGDSISCGYGVLGPDATCTETPAYEDHDDSYGAITARNLSADLHTTASSGLGMYRNDDGTTTGTLPDIYGLTLPYVTSGTPSSWSVSSWVPDAVVIDLGTNDFVTGDPGQPYVTTYTAFVRMLRQSYPNAYILCTNGPMLGGTDYTTAQTDIQSVLSTLNDPNVGYLAYPTQTGAEGCDGHPSVATQAAMATQLTAALKSKLAW